MVPYQIGELANEGRALKNLGIAYEAPVKVKGEPGILIRAEMRKLTGGKQTQTQEIFLPVAGEVVIETRVPAFNLGGLRRRSLPKASSRAEVRGREDEVKAPRLEMPDSIPARTDDDQPSHYVSLGNLSQDISEQGLKGGGRKKKSPQKDNSMTGTERKTQEIAKIGITSHEHVSVLPNPLMNLFIGGTGNDLAAVQNFMAGLAERFRQGPGTIGIDQEFHERLIRVGREFLLVGEKRGVEDAGLNPFIRKGRELLFKLFKAQPRGQGFENHMNRRSGVADTGAPSLDFPPHGDMLFNQASIHPDPSSNSRKIYHTPRVLSRDAIERTHTPALLSSRADVRADSGGREKEELPFR